MLTAQGKAEIKLEMHTVTLELCKQCEPNPSGILTVWLCADCADYYCYHLILGRHGASFLCAICSDRRKSENMPVESLRHT